MFNWLWTVMFSFRVPSTVGAWDFNAPLFWPCFCCSSSLRWSLIQVDPPFRHEKSFFTLHEYQDGLPDGLKWCLVTWRLVDKIPWNFQRDGGCVCLEVFGFFFGCGYLRYHNNIHDRLTLAIEIYFEIPGFLKASFKHRLQTDSRLGRNVPMVARVGK